MTRFGGMILITSVCFLLFSGRLSAEDNEIPTAKSVAVSAGKIGVRTQHTPQEQAIFDVLENEVLFEFPGNPLEDVVDFLADIHQIPVLIDTVALEDIGLMSDVEVKLVIKKLSLHHALTLLLRPHDLSYVVRDGALLITSGEEADFYTETRVYDVRPLRVQDPDALADVLIYTTGDETWSEFGGPGDLSYFQGSIIIKQNQKTHREIESLLNLLKSDIESSPESVDWPVRERKVKQPNKQQVLGTGDGYF